MSSFNVSYFSVNACSYLAVRVDLSLAASASFLDWRANFRLVFISSNNSLNISLCYNTSGNIFSTHYFSFVLAMSATSVDSSVIAYDWSSAYPTRHPSLRANIGISRGLFTSSLMSSFNVSHFSVNACNSLAVRVALSLAASASFLGWRANFQLAFISSNNSLNISLCPNTSGHIFSTHSFSFVLAMSAISVYSSVLAYDWSSAYPTCHPSLVANIGISRERAQPPLCCALPLVMWPKVWRKK